LLIGLKNFLDDDVKRELRQLVRAFVPSFSPPRLSDLLDIRRCYEPLSNASEKGQALEIPEILAGVP